ncbi:ABC transporter ATP-binding/permease protein YojI [Kordia antarctica]|uniref:ABC transporter ATP-binding/permease protein YojI n=1 Tax=Kordia antarctica TaxID=1218801 RepID=A0A7L4ZGQ5_9FLAO|nr:cyclic peptide export ABC transporter [Kordia antarctica]QHI35436.1 ABC transporter ATP-binding/permease protein YojI [Kordia antarctica]
MFKFKKKDILLVILYAIPNTILSFSVIYIINNVLSGNQNFLRDYMIIVFSAIIVYSYLLNIVFQKGLNKYAFKILYENEKKLFDQILKAPLITLENFGTQRFYTAMEDLRIFSNLPYVITHTVSSLLMLVIGLIYMISLSVPSAIVVSVLIVLLALSYFIIMNSMSKEVATLRKYNEHYYGYVNDLIRGFKELKLSANRRKNIMNEYLGPNRDASEGLDFKINYVFLSINMISQYGLHFLIAVVMFGLPALGLLDRAGVISYVVVILFISGPINNLINLQQTYTRFMVANRRIKKFRKDFQIEEDRVDTPQISTSFQSIEFKNICFNYEEKNKENTFTLGPVNLEVKKGEVIFIIGGNGSGKSTFINILTGLYQPSDGEIIVNESSIIDPKSELQNYMTAIFTNNHIFSKNYDDYKLESNKEYQELLKQMELDVVVEDDKEESARRNFSKGQSKRMSMIFALLEKKPVLILDEWAADQDPYFRKFFYEELIPKFKKDGKTIIAVTHDDAYFNHADRIIKFDFGKIIKDLKTEDKKQIKDLSI